MCVLGTIMLGTIMLGTIMLGTQSPINLVVPNIVSLQIYYIVGAQQLEGYGQECFLAKDDAGNEVLLGASLIGG